MKKSDSLKNRNIFNQWFKGRTRVGLDIGAHSLKIVELEDTGKGLSLKKAGYKEINLPTVSTSKTPESEKNAIVESINEIWHDLKIKNRQIYVVISEPSIYLRHITIPYVSEAELSKAIKWQAEKYVPFPIDEAIVDFQIIGSDKRSPDDQMKIIIIAVKKDVINNYLSIFQTVKLNPTVIDVTPFALAKLVIRQTLIDEKEVIPVIDIGKKTTSVSIVGHSGLQLVRMIDLAGQNFTQALTVHMGLSSAEAEEKKKDSAVSDLLPALDSTLVELVSQVERSLAYLEREGVVKEIRRMYLAGGGSLIKELDAYLAAKLNLPVKYLNSFEGVSFQHCQTNAIDLKIMSPNFISALGGVLS
jgi:type IV pilus assembly protein PilM